MGTFETRAATLGIILPPFFISRCWSCQPWYGLVSIIFTCGCLFFLWTWALSVTALGDDISNPFQAERDTQHLKKILQLITNIVIHKHLANCPFLKTDIDALMCGDGGSKLINSSPWIKY